MEIEKKERCNIYLTGEKTILRKGLKVILSIQYPEQNIFDTELYAKEIKPPMKVDLLIICTESITSSKVQMERYGGGCPVIIFSDIYTMQDIVEYVSMKCYCLMHSSSTEEAILGCVNLCLHGVIFFDWKLSPLLSEGADRFLRISLLPAMIDFAVTPTVRELEIARYILLGMENTDIAKELYLSTGTVRNIVSIILEKYRFRNRAQIISLLLH